MRIIIVALMLVAIMLGTLQPAKITAEAGCSMWGSMSYFSSTQIRANGGYNCGSDYASGNRALQVCLQRLNYGNTGCVYFGGRSDASFGTYVNEYCTSTLGTYSYRSFVWFRGEDGSTQTYYSPYVSYRMLCS
jgi:hypothetical protein